VLDVSFIERHTHGFDAFADDLRRTSWDDIVQASGLPRDQLERIAGIYMRARAVIICYGMGITQHRHGTENVQQIVNLLLLRGNFGKAGAGICPVRGHSNVQGDRTVGIDEKPKPAFLDQLRTVFGFDPPRAHRHNVVDAVQAMVDGRAKVFIGLGGGMANATLPNCGIDWNFFVADYGRIRDKIEAVFPDLFGNFAERISRPGGFHLNTPPRQLVWNTATGRANFLIVSGVDEDPPVPNSDALRLTTIRSHDQYNTTIYGLDDRYRGVFGGRMVVFMNEVDMQARGFAPGTLVEIESLADDGRKRVVRGFSVKPHSIPIGSVGAYYPETNPLLPLAHHDPKSGTPAAKSIPVLVRPLGG
jgi:anaerobic selenocysteine-containing dehydrogenase